MKLEKIAVVGGDQRNARLASILATEGSLSGAYALELSGLNNVVRELPQFELLLQEAKAVIGPIPFSNDGMTLNAPFHQGRLYIHDLFKSMKRGQVLIAGKFDDKVKDNAELFGIKLIEILDREEMTVMNAIPTAEGALQIAMEETSVTLHGSNCLILGYGRIGKVLSRMLEGIGANVYVTARKKSDLAWIECMKYNALTLEKIPAIASSFDVVFNTIPATIINEQILGSFRPDCLLIDLASKPGGIDFDVAKLLGLKTIWALSLPGRVAPDSAAKYIKNTVKNILCEMEE